MARRMGGAGLEEDLVSAGQLGLAVALARSGPSESEQFEAYATRHIRGAMLDELRRYDPLTRPQRREVRRVERVAKELERSLGRAADPVEIAEAAGISERAYWVTLQVAHRGRMASLDALEATNEFRPSAWPSPDSGPEQRAAARIAWSRVCAKSGCLTPRERDVLGFELSGGLAQSEIAAALGVTVARVSQLRASAIARLRRECGLLPEDGHGLGPQTNAGQRPARKRRSRFGRCHGHTASLRPMATEPRRGARVHRSQDHQQSPVGSTGH